VSASAASPATATARIGVAAGLAAYGTWGLLPLYIKTLADVPSVEFLAHRVVWSVPTLVVLLTLLRGWGSVRRGFSPPRRGILPLCATAVLITSHRLAYIYTVNSGRILQASLGYFINPLISVLFGFLFLHETMTRRQWVAIAFAAAGVSFLVVRVGMVPVLSLTLALTFASYGLLRKTISVDGYSGLFFETLLMLPLFLGYLLWLGWQGSGAFGTGSPARDGWLLFGGPITAIPLALFGVAVQRVRLATIGLMQYVTPTSQFLLAVLVYGEDFSSNHLAAFSLIWTGLVIYSLPRNLLEKFGLSVR